MKVEMTDTLIDNIFIEELKVQFKKAAEVNDVNLTLAVCTVLKKVLTKTEYENWTCE